MSQRKALIASIAITLFLALSAIGIRAVMLDSPATEASGTTQTTSLSAETSAGQNAFSGGYDDDEHDRDAGSSRDDDGGYSHDGDHDDEDDDDD